MIVTAACVTVLSSNLRFLYVLHSSFTYCTDTVRTQTPTPTSSRGSSPTHPTRRHLSEDPREEVGVGVGVVECALNATFINEHDDDDDDGTTSRTTNPQQIEPIEIELHIHVA